MAVDTAAGQRHFTGEGIAGLGVEARHELLAAGNGLRDPERELLRAGLQQRHFGLPGHLLGHLHFVVVEHHGFAAKLVARRFGRF